MTKGFVDSDVKDKVRGAEILSRLLEVVREGTVVRVGSKTIRFDKTRCRRYTESNGEPGEVGVPVDTDGS